MRSQVGSVGVVEQDPCSADVGERYFRPSDEVMSMLFVFGIYHLTLGLQTFAYDPGDDDPHFYSQQKTTVCAWHLCREGFSFARPPQ